MGYHQSTWGLAKGEANVSDISVLKETLKTPKLDSLYPWIN